MSPCRGPAIFLPPMTNLSVNINKIALIRNSRGRNYPDVGEFARRCIDFGAHGITLHPRPDQRHARYSDIHLLKRICDDGGVELNVEGYPVDRFLQEVLDAVPAQCTLVPDSPDQVTSDHGWRIAESRDLLERIIPRLTDRGIRVSLFVDHDNTEMDDIHALGADRVELYTEPYAEAFGSNRGDRVLESFRAAAQRAQQAGLDVNAGHDLNLENLERFLTIPGILEVSIGHALIVESIELGLGTVIARYLEIIRTAAAES